MSFNPKALLALVAILSASACVFRFREQVDNSSIQLTGTDLGCLAGSTQTVSEYFTGRLADDAPLNRFWDCLSKSLDTFGSRTRGAVPGQYTPEELRRFLQTYFLKGYRISDPLLKESMELKRIAVGGNTDAVSIKELEDTERFLKVLKRESARLRPYIPFEKLTQPGASPELFEQAMKALERTSLEIGEFLKGTSPYLFSHFEVLLGELENLFDGQVGEVVAASRARILLFQRIKVLMMGSSLDRVEQGEWPLLLQTLAKSYEIRLRYLFISRNYATWSSGPGREAYMRMMSEGYDLISLFASRHPFGVLPYAQLDLLIDSVGEQALPVKPENLKRFMRVVGRKFLRGGEVEGFTPANFKLAWNILERWSEGQRYLERLYYHLDPIDNLRRSFVPEELLSWTEVAPEGLRERLQRRPEPMFYGDDSEMLFLPHNRDRRHSFHNLSEMNWIYEMARALLDAYSDNKSAVDQTRAVTFPQFKEFIKDVRDIGIDLKLFDPSNNWVAEQRFMEANLFTYASDGNDLMSLDEGAELMAFMISGRRQAARIHELISQECEKEMGEVDPFGFRRVGAKCFREALYRNFERIWDRMPGLASHYRSLSAEEQAKFRVLFEKASRKSPMSDAMINYGDIQAFAMVAHYMEAIFTRFDVDHSSTLSLSEALTALPVYEGTLREILKRNRQTDDTDNARALFTYLLNYGEPPEANLSGWLSFTKWKWTESFWGFEADRGRILSIFAELAKQGRHAR